MLESTTMTYLIVGNTPQNIEDEVRKLISKLWQRDIDMDIFTIQNPDYHLLDGRDKNSIGIEQMKELQQDMVYTPFKELVQIALIFDSGKLTTQAQNSILKTLEESSDTTVYILTASSEKALLPTISSRSRKIYIKETIGQSTTFDDIHEFLSLTLVDKFLKLETISKSKGECLDFLERVEGYFQDLLESNINEGVDVTMLMEYLSLVLKTSKRIKANGNRKLMLENLFLQLQNGF
jgi:hypothetical protein